MKDDVLIHSGTPPQYHVCSFSSDVADLKGRNRTKENVLGCLRRNPEISTFEFSEHYRWLQPLIEQLIRQGAIKEVNGSFPWHRYKVLV